MTSVSDKPLDEVAESFGFSSLSCFDLTFRRVCGYTPSSYRWELQVKYAAVDQARYMVFLQPAGQQKILPYLFYRKTVL